MLHARIVRFDVTFLENFLQTNQGPILPSQGELPLGDIQRVGESGIDGYGAVHEL